MLWYGIQSLDPRWRRKQSPNAQIMLVGGACRVHRSIAVRPWVPVGFNIVEMQIGDSFTASSRTSSSTALTHVPLIASVQPC